jgi:hypothetical protein
MATGSLQPRRPDVWTAAKASAAERDKAVTVTSETERHRTSVVRRGPSLGLAPAPGGILGLFLAGFVFTRLTQPSSSPDDAAVRLFAAFFLLFGLLFLGDAIRGARSGRLRGPLGPLPLGLAAAIVTAVVIPFHTTWTAPWSLFNWLVVLLDVVALVLGVAFVVRLRRRSGAAHPPRRLSADRALGRRQRLGFAAMLFGSMGLLVGWLGVQQATADWRHWSDAVRVSGVVTRQIAYNFRGRDGRPVLNSAAVIRYQVDGKSFETIQRIDPAVAPRYGKGATVPLIYNAAAPSQGRLANAFESFLISGALLMLTVVFLGLGGMAAARAAETAGDS